MKKTILLAAVALSACGTADPETRYYQANQMYVATLRVADRFASECAKKPVADACHARVEQIRGAVRVADEAFEHADLVFVTKDSPGYETALGIARGSLRTVGELLAGGVD
jgi:uncharacterized lipoprotein YmbA